MNLGTYILMGRSGSGKGTQAKLLIEELRRRDTNAPVTYLEAGEKFRELLARDTFTSKIASQMMKEGKLQPAFLAIHNWSHLFIENITGKEQLVIDGSPRKLNEARILAEALRFYKRTTPTVLHINVSRNWAKDRLVARKRSDDELANIEARLAWFESDVIPAIEYFSDEQDFKVLNINGEQTIEEVNKEIISKVFGSN